MNGMINRKLKLLNVHPFDDSGEALSLSNSGLRHSLLGRKG
jgi:hypothetical protein